eukprot:7083586-Pyramimonas_sp.AAC.1
MIRASDIVPFFCLFADGAEASLFGRTATMGLHSSNKGKILSNNGSSHSEVHALYRRRMPSSIPHGKTSEGSSGKLQDEHVSQNIDT